MATDATFIPYFQSGALGRDHYNLVRAVETAKSQNDVDSAIHGAVTSCLNRLPQANIKQCRECLVELLYASMSGYPLQKRSLDFALPFASNLAQMGRTTQEKRTGYLFVVEVMEYGSSMELMLVNTLRKDLESSTVAHICLALEIIIRRPSEDVLPAVSNRIHELLSHSSPFIRQRALLAYRALSKFDHDMFLRIEDKIIQRLQDSDLSVQIAAIDASTTIILIDGLARERLQPIIEVMLHSTWSEAVREPKRLLAILGALRNTGISSKSLPLITPMLKFAIEHSQHTLILPTFSVLMTLDSQTIYETIRSGMVTPISDVRDLLTSENVNDRYLFLSCLDLLDPMLWAGTTEEIPAVLEEWEVERLMLLLDSPDSLIRVKTIRILKNIDTDIIDSYYSKSIQSFCSTSALSLNSRNEFVSRLVEVLIIRHDGDGGSFAESLRDLFVVVESASSEQDTAHVLEKPIELILSQIRNGDETFRLGTVTALATYAANNDGTRFGPTVTATITALVTEYSQQISIPPAQLLLGFADWLSQYPAAVQDVLLLTMLRVSADCDDLPPSVDTAVKNVAETSSRYIRNRCQQFLSLSSDKATLRDLIKNAKSASLPGFLDALTNKKFRDSSRSPSVSNASPVSQSVGLGSKLRYEAYARPSPPKYRDRPRRGSSSTSVARSVGSSSSSRLSPVDVLSKTVTAGDLTLATGAEELEMMNLASSKPSSDANRVDDLTSKVDLIAFDSPFISDPVISDPATANPGADFEALWNRLDDASRGGRGWHEGTCDEIIERLRTFGYLTSLIGPENAPFPGEAKVTLSKAAGRPPSALLRLRETEDGSLWRYRSENPELSKEIKRMLSG